MRLLALWMVVLTAVPAAPLCAQRVFLLSDPAISQPRQSANPSFSIQVSDEFAPDGTQRQRRGILAGIDVAPQTTIGIGFFDSSPKMRGPGFESRIDSYSKKSRKAAVGMSFRF